MSRFTRKFQVALATMALVALSVGSVAPVSAQVVLQGLGVAKGCVGSTPVGSPYVCAYGFTNNSGVNPSNNTITVTSVVDSVFASGGNVSSGNILASLSLLFSGTASCVGGSGLGTIASPYVGATSCTIPQNSGILTQSFSFYTVTNADFGLANHVLADQVTANWQAICDVTPGCSTLPSANQAVGQTTITPGSPSIVTTATPTIVVGQTAQDTATISGLLGANPAGNIVFTLFGPETTATCAAADLVFTSAPFPVSANGTVGPATSPALTAPGNYFWVASYTDTNGSNANVATPCGDANETTVVQQPDANIQITPATATNAVGTNHTLTGHVNVSDDGTTFANAPAGTTITFSIVSGPGSFVGGNTCLTIAATGSCTVQISSAATGTTVINAATDVTVNTVLLHRATGDAHAGDSANAEKAWVNANIAITPATATNPIGTNHVLTITVNAINGTLADGTATATIESGPGTFVGSPTCTYTGGGASASCTVTITSAAAGTTVVSATSAISVSGQSISRTTGTAVNTAAGGSGNASKLWVQPAANIQITPATATNAVGTNHTLTGHVNVSDDGTTFVNAPAGTTITFSIVSGPGSFVGGNTCLTIAATGSCTVQITSAVDGTTVIHAATDVTVNTVALHVETDGAGSNSGDASKIWVNANIAITPATATNPINTNHVLTITVNALNGTLADGTATASIESGPGTFVGSPTCSYTGGAATATCTVTITSAVAGTTVVSATSNISVNGQSITRTTNTAVNTAAGGSGNASKLWQQPDANIQITPANATNPVGTNHTLTGHVNVSVDGTTFTNAPAGTLITFSIVSGPGGFVGGNTCTTIGTTGSCTVQITSAATGTTVVHAATDVTVNTVALHRETDGTGNNSGDAQKLWVQPAANIQITPATATNAVGTNHTLTGHVNVSVDGTTFTNAPAGTTITFSIVSGPGSFVGGNTCLTVGTTGSCTVQITSAATGTTVVHAATDVTVNTVALHVETDGAGSNSGDASKIWVNANIAITPATATNPINTNHVLTITVNALNGTLADGTATASIESGPGSFVGSPTCSYTGGAATATCTVTITSAVAGTTVVSATSNISVNGQSITRTTNTAVNTAAGGSGNAQKIWKGGGGQILPTNTTCQDFTSGTTPALPGINYSLSGAGKIGQNINPGVFFYYTFVTTTTANQSVSTSQHATNSSPLFSLNQGHAWLYTADCTLVSQPSGTTTVTTTIAQPGTYVLRLQYSTKSIAGLTGPANGAVYTFDIDGVDNASVPLVKQ